MKRIGLFALIAVLTVGLAVYLGACGGGGGGSSSNNNAVVSYSTATQAATSSNNVNGAITLSSTVGTATSAAGDAIPAGYAPSKAKSLRAKKANTDAIASIDPRLKTAVDAMMSELNHPAIKKSLIKAKGLRAKNLHAPIVEFTEQCPFGGSVTISGSDDSVQGSYYDYTINVAFTNCGEGINSLNYELMNGSLNAHHRFFSTAPTSTYLADVTATNLAMASYSSGTLYLTTTLNGTFNSSDNGTSGSDSANGSFKMTMGTDEFTFTMNNVATSWTDVVTASSETWEDTTNGSFTWAFASGGQTVISATLSFTNLAYRGILYSADQSMDEWLSGTISMTWIPALDSSCIPGTITIATTTPMHTPYLSSCPTSGVMTINNAQIEFGNPSGTQVTVTVNGSPQVFTDCSFSGAGGTCFGSGSSSNQPAAR